MNKNIQQHPTIDVSQDEFGCVLNCAVRYALGRQTYMPHLIMEYIQPLLVHLNKRTLVCMERDIREAESYGVGYGNEKIDKPAWMKFLEEIQKELLQRGDT